jgi:hypothetical protein
VGVYGYTVKVVSVFVRFHCRRFKEFEGFNEFFRIDDDKLRRMIAATNGRLGDVDYITWSMLFATRDVVRDAKRMVP